MTSSSPAHDDSQREEPLAVVGIGCLFPGSHDQKGYWAGIREGLDQIVEIPESHWSVNDYFDSDPSSPDRTYGKKGGFIDPVLFSPIAEGITPRDLEATDTAQLLGLVAARRALEDGGYGSEAVFDRSRVSVILGITGALELVVPLGARLGHPLWWRALKDSGVDEETARRVVEQISSNYVQWQENSFPGLLGNVVAGRIANRLDLGGTNCVTDAACASSLAALHLAAMELRNGRCDMVVTGGIDTFNDIFMYTCFSKTPALSPSGDARPFDRDGDGTTLGEGLGVVVLKRLADAIADGDRIYARILSIGTSSDGRGTAIYAPSADGQVRALEDAYQQAGISPGSVQLIEAHGTGTAVGDAAEVMALSKVFGEAQARRQGCAIGSVKSQIGHTKAAAGAAGMIKAILALHHKVIPPTIKVRQPLDELVGEKSPFYLSSEARPWSRRGNHQRRAGVSSFGFGGSNFHCVLEEHSTEKTEVNWTGSVQIFAFSAPENGGLRRSVQRCLDSLDALNSWEKTREMAAQTRTDFRWQERERLLLVVRRDEELPPRLEDALRRLEDSPELPFSTPAGTHRGRGAASGKIAFIFPGQGSQYPGMLRGAACTFPEFSAALDEAEDVFWEKGGPDEVSLSDRIWPPTAWSDEGRMSQQEALRDTRVAQPALGVASIGLEGVLRRFGIKAESFAGHSFGELTALRASKRLRSRDFHQLANFRGQLMAEAGGSDAGAMIAVALPLVELEHILEVSQLDIAIANRNAPDQAVLSGSSSEIDRAANLLSDRGIRHRRLQVSAAFHSPLVASAKTPFRDILRRAEIAPGRERVYANSTGEPYPDDPDDTRETLAGQIALPVLFEKLIRAMYGDGIRTFIEVGPKAVLTGLVRKILDQQPDALAIASDPRSRPDDSLHGLAVALASIASAGHAIDLSRWDEGFEIPSQPDPKMAIEISGANFRPGEGIPAPQAAPPRAPDPVAAVAPPSPPLKPIAEPGPTSPRGSEYELLIEALEAANDAQERLHQAQVAAENTLEGAISDDSSGTRDETPPAVEMPLPEAPSTAAAPGIATTIVEVVAEKTGYPIDAIGETLDLESDLGIDSIKRVEILAALRERRPELPAVPPEALGTLRTIDQIARWYGEREALVVAPVEASPGPVAHEPPATASPPGSSPEQDGNLREAIIEVVADKTGYPADAIGTDLDLESDLGIDSIKRVEILSSLREKQPGLPAVPPEMLATLRTIDQIVLWYADEKSDRSQHPVPESTTPAPSARQGVPPSNGLTAAIVVVIADKTGYPADAIGTDLDLESDLGIDSIKRVEILSALRELNPGLPAVPPDMLATLRTIEQIAGYYAGEAAASPGHAEGAPEPDPAPETVVLDEARENPRLIRAGLRPVAIDRQTPEPLTTPPEGSPWWVICHDRSLASAILAQLANLGVDAQLAPDDFDSPPEILSGLLLVEASGSGDDQGIIDAFRWLRHCGPALEKGAAEGSARLVIVGRSDGCFGLSGDAEGIDPSAGALAGLAKTAAREWGGVSVRAIDLAREVGVTARAAEEIVGAALTDGPVEIGISRGSNHTLALVPSPLEGESNASIPLSPGDLVVVTGGARGVTGVCVEALARRCKAAFLLLGRTAIDEEEEPWLRKLDDSREIEKHLFAALGSGTPPAEVRRQANALLRAREVRRQIEKLKAIGAEVTYRSLDARRPAELSRAIEEATRLHGPVRGLVHGAGVIADRRIIEKSDSQFGDVLSTKVEAARALLALLQEAPLRFICFFSSTTARLGRIGQCDYAAANEALNKIARRESIRRPECRVVSINWGPWDGGMVTSQLRQVFIDEGIDVIAPADGAQAFLQELAEPPGSEVEPLWIAPGEVAEGLLERLATFPLQQPPQLSVPGAPGEPSAPRRTPVTEDSDAHELAISIDLDLDNIGVLKDHVIDRRPVVPMALILEWCAQAAVHRHPGINLVGVDQLQILKGVVLRGQSHQLDFFIGTATAEGGTLRIPVEVRGISGERKLLHARCSVLLGDRMVAPPPQQGPAGESYDLDRRSIYSDRLFHGPRMQGIEGVDRCGEEGIIARCQSAPTPERWIRDPLRAQWLTDPLLIDGAFQAMILWSQQCCLAGSLPCTVGSYRQYSDPRPGVVELRAHIIEVSDHAAKADIDIVDSDGTLRGRIEGYECIIDGSLDRAFRSNQLPEEASS